MKKLIKKLIAYDKIYGTLKDSFFYQSYKKFRAKFINMLNDYPSKDFFVIGVTGTNGKTTVVNLLHKILNDNIAPTVAISTAAIKIGNVEMENKKKMTSPDCKDLQELLATAKAQGCKIAILETSSQGLDQYRFEGIKFDFAVLTNITEDHLDYHKTMEKYADAKKRLFNYVMKNGKEKKYAAICVDDKYGKRRFEEMAFDQKISYSLNNSSVIKATKIEECFEGTYYEFSYLGKKYSGTTQLIGSYNICNILGAISVAAALGLEIEPVIKSVEDFPGVAGRMDPVYINGAKFFVDFAHTPDGLEKTLSFASTRKGDGRLITICGAPGNREKEKRPTMGSIAVNYSDIVIFTDDDPDTENRLKILNEMTKPIQEKGYPRNKKVFIIPEREYAIQFSTEIIKQNDIVVICGMGHENTQYTNFGVRKRNDKTQLINILESQGKTILNAKEIKKQYLKKLKDAKNENHITVEQYYQGGTGINSSSTQQPQIRSGMFKPIE